MAIEVHPATVHSYGSGEEANQALPDSRAAESVQAFDPVYLSRLPGAILSRQHIVGDDGTLLTWGSPALAAWQPVRRVASLTGTYFALTGLWSEGYAHWLLDVLPRLMALPLLDQATRILVSEPFPTWKAQSLARAGIDLAMVKVVGEQPTRVDTLYLVGPVGSPAHCHPLAATWLRSTYLDPAADRRPTRRLYITRRRAAKRRLINEGQLLDALKPVGFEAVDAERLSFDEQIEAYQQASVVVGPHGAGLANLVFCTQGTAVVELRPRNYPQFSYEWLSSHCGLRYRSVVGVAVEAELPSVQVDRKDFTVNPDEVVRRLAELGVSG